MADVLLFAGPSASGIAPGRFEAAGVRVLPPVRRDDVQRLVDEIEEPGVIIVCDGVFQVAAAVSHAELCEAVDTGWDVWGVSSIGAIRAHELRHEGMRGFGQVHAMFTAVEDFTDDEMCLLHLPEPPWIPVTEALVNVRHALACRGPALGIGEESARSLLAGLRALWFGDRTNQRIRALMIEQAGCDERQADDLLGWLATHRLKTMDLERMLAQRPWRAAEPGAGTP
jgi:hypothetical protein